MDFQAPAGLAHVTQPCKAPAASGLYLDIARTIFVVLQYPAATDSGLISMGGGQLGDINAFVSHLDGLEENLDANVIVWVSQSAAAAINEHFHHAMTQGCLAHLLEEFVRQEVIHLAFVG